MISVIMGINRFDDYVPLAINSVLAQSFEAFELIIVANGAARSEVASEIVQRYASDSRVRVLETQIPQLAYALNLAVDHAVYDYIARMDADDLCSPLRLQKQFDFMLANNLDLVGCDVLLINEHGEAIGERVTKKGRLIGDCLWRTNTLIHPTTLFRKDAFLRARGYNAGFNSEDYDLWIRLKRSGVKWDNMGDCLLSYRIHSGASQRRLLGYAEVTGLSMREFVLERKFKHLAAAFMNMAKAFVYGR